MAVRIVHGIPTKAVQGMMHVPRVPTVLIRGLKAQSTFVNASVRDFAFL